MNTAERYEELRTEQGGAATGDRKVVSPDVPHLPPEKFAALERLAGRREELDPEQRAMVEELAKLYKIPLAPQPGFVEKLNRTRQAVEEMKPAALPMLGQAAGGIAAQALSPGNIPLSAGLQGAGAMLGVKGNELLGISKPDEIDYLLSGGVGLTGPLLRLGRRAFPGSAAAEQEIAAGEMAKIPQTVEGSKHATDAAYAAIDKTMRIPVTNFSKTIDTLGAHEQRLRVFGEDVPALRRRLDKSAQEILNQGGTLDLDTINGLLKRQRERVASAEAKGGEQYGAYKVLRQSLFQDMEAATKAGGPGGQQVQALRTAMAEAKKRIAHEELSEIFQRYGTKYVEVGNQVFQQIDPVRVLNKLRDIEWAKTAGAGEFNRVRQMLIQLAKVPEPQMAQRSGLGTTGRVTAAAGIAGAAAMAGGPVSPLVAAASAATLVATHNAVARLSMSETGRKFLVKLFTHNKGRVGERTGQVIQFFASQLQDTEHP